MPARACGTIRTPAAATMNTNTARTIRAISPAVMRSPSFAHERGRAPDLENMHAGPRLDDLVVVGGPRCPHPAARAPAAAALGVADPLHHGRGLAHERRGARPDPAAGALVLA